MIYTELEIKQKQIKTIKVENHVFKENSNVNNVAAKINKFFVHCLGLHVFIRETKVLFLTNIDFIRNLNNLNNISMFFNIVKKFFKYNF